MNLTLKIKQLSAFGLIALFTSFNVNAADSQKLSHDGLVQIKSEEHKIVFMRPGVDFAEYDKIHLMEAQVAFRKNWQKVYNKDRDKTGERISDKDAIEIKQDMKALFDKVFTEELKSNGYPVIDDLQTGTLIIKPSLVNLEFTAPQTSSPTINKTYIKATGSVTLYLEFFDGVSGEVLARVGEGKIIGEREHFTWASQSRNMSDAKKVLQEWATALRKHLDEANHKAKTPAAAK